MGSDAEETARRDTHVSDSGYSHSCTNSQSQRSSSKSRDSSSGGSSGYEGNNGAGSEGAAQTKRTKDKDRKRKSKSSGKKIEDAQPKEEGDQPMDTSPHPDDGLQTAILSQTLSSMKKIKNFDVLSDNSLGSPDCTPEVLIDPEELQRGRELIEEDFELKIVVSMEDGNVVYTSGLVDVLGYPNEMWFGRSLVEFIQPKHRVTFACQITTAIANLRPGTSSIGPKTFFCCLRIYKGLKVLGFNSNKTVPFLPCQLSFDFQELTPVGQTARKEYLVIKAKPVRSAYNYPSETKVSRKFMTRHSANFQFIHLDPEVMPYFGYIPQDLLGKSVLDLYHPEDLHFLKEVYEAVMKEQGHLFRSKPYRFRCQNGDYALVETELSSFINPWSRKLEFVIGQHSVLRGPRNPDVVTPVAVLEPLQISAEVLKETKIVQEEIKCLLNESQVRTSETVKQQVTKRCKDLAVFMENLMDEMSKPPNLKIDVPTEEQSFSERDSVMLGEISPHHDYYDSKSSSGTPPSYNQLNYNENIQRFFESKPKTSPSGDSAKTKNASGENEEKESPAVDSSIASKSGSGTGTDPSTESHANSAETTGTSNTPEQTNLPTLTEQLLIRHNEDMEKQMVQKHKGMRKNDFKIKERLKDKVHELSKAFPEESTVHGVKRCGSQSWDGEPFKLIKSNPNMNSAPNSIKGDSSTLWPPIAVPLPMPFNRENSTFANALMPMCYMTNRDQKPLYTQQLQYVPLYHPIMFGTPPVMYSPVTVYPPVYPNDEQPQGNVDQHPSTSRHQNTLGTEPSNDNNMSNNFNNSNIKNRNNNNNNKSHHEGDSKGTSIPYDDSSYNSSLYSFLKTDKSDESLKSCSESDKPESADCLLNQKPRPIRKVAPWMEGVTVTPELIFNYRLEEKSIEEILKRDMERLEMIRQPSLVNEQLSQLYVDFELEGLSRQLTLEESPSSSDSSDERPSTCSSQERKKQRNRFMEHDKMTIHFEEDAPMPPPLSA